MRSRRRPRASPRSRTPSRWPTRSAVEPGAPKILTGSTFASGATPATPTPLPVAAAIVPATCVPWKLLWVSTVLSPLTKSQPRQSSTRPLPSSSTPFVSRAAAALAGVAPELADEVGVRQLDPGVDDRDRRPGAARDRPGLRRVDVGVRRARCAEDRLPGVVQAPLVGEGRVARGREDGGVRLGVDDVGVRLERRDRALDVAGLRDDHLGVAQRQHGLEPDAGVGAEVGALGAVEPGDALDDDRVVRRGEGGEDERGDERADGDGDAHTPVIVRPGRCGRRSPCAGRTSRSARTAPVLVA